MFKNTCLAIIVSSFLLSCYAYKAPAIKIGMSLEEFKDIAKYEQLVAMDKEYTVYVLAPIKQENYSRFQKLIKRFVFSLKSGVCPGSIFPSV